MIEHREFLLKSTKILQFWFLLFLSYLQYKSDVFVVKMNDNYHFLTIQKNNKKPLVKLSILVKLKFFSKKIKEILLKLNYLKINFGKPRNKPNSDSELVDG